MRKKAITILLIFMLFIVGGVFSSFAIDSEATNEGQVEEIGETEANEGNQEPRNTLKAVTGFEALSSYNAVILKWKAVKGADKYIINWSGNGKKGSFTTREKAYTHEIPVDKKFKYSIVAVDKDGVTSEKPVKITGEAVRSMYLKVTFKTNRTLTSHTGGKVKATFKAGKTIITNGFYEGKYIFNWKGKDGKTRQYYVKKISIKNPKVYQLNTKREYTKEEAESYVNRRNIASKTKNLIWVNQYTQRLYVFKGSKGKWKCIKGPWLVASGKPTSPTSTGVTKIKQKERSNGAPFWSVCNFFSFHGNAKVWGNLGYPKSGACVRNTNEHAEWIFYNAKIGTAVCVN